MSDDDTPDLRKYRRVPMDAVIGVETSKVLANGVDISMSGIRLKCVGLAIEVGDRLRVTVTLEDRTFDVCGTAVRVVQVDALAQEVALAFSDVDPEAWWQKALAPDES